MGLFKKDKSADEYYHYQDARKEFTKENSKMTNSIKQKTNDPENIEYDKIHTTIYSGVGLGEDWRVDESIDYEEINTASSGFKKVTAKFQTFTEKQESNSILFIIKRIFGLL
jgi:hypothetical protein